MTSLHHVAEQRNRRLERADRNISRCPECGAWQWRNVCTVDHEAMRAAIDTGRFWSVVRTGHPEECWIFTGPVADTGYGITRWAEKNAYAHRVAYELHHGSSVPDGWHTDHLCRVKLCVNPAHLEAVEPRENFIRGEHPNAVIHRRNICKHGHPFTPENTYIRPNGTRNCKECRRRSTTAGRFRRVAERGYR